MAKYKNYDQTRENLIAAFWEIYKQKGIRQMSISEVCQKAGCHRSTFYNHFKSLDEILDFLEEKTFDHEGSAEELKNALLASGNFQSTIGYLYKHTDYVGTLLGPNGDPGYSAKAIQAKLPLWREAFACPENEGLADYAVAYLIGGAHAVYGMWLDRNKEIPEVEMGSLFSLLHNNGPVAVLLPETCPGIKADLRLIVERVKNQAK